MDKKKEIGLNIKTARLARGYTQAELARKLGQSPSSITMYENGRREPEMEVMEAIADIFNVPITAITGKGSSDESLSIPLIGTIACGTPILAEENVLDYINVPLFVHADFALRCKGRSMINARIMDGDIVCIKQQNDVNDGQIAAVLIDDEATLKRVYHNPDGSIVLQAESPSFPPITVGRDGTVNVRIIGLAIHFISKVI